MADSWRVFQIRSSCRAGGWQVLLPALLVVALAMLAGCSFDSGMARPIDDDSGWQVGESDTGADPNLDASPATDTTPSPDTGDGATLPVPDTGGDGDTGPGAGDVGGGDTDPGDPDSGTPDTGSPDTGSPDAGPISDVCDGEEVDLQTDPRHCGHCSNACDGGFGMCNGGTCECTSGFEVCSTGNGCHDTSRDPNHCGGCNNRCAPGAHCDDGECRCRDGLTLCNGVCVDTDRNPAHCGGCDTTCGNGGRCDGGSCHNGGRCGFGKFDCQQAGSKACFSVREVSNPLYCAPALNQCGSECAGDEICSQAGIISQLRCRTVRPGRGCESCPCDDCHDDERCVEDPDGMNGVFCMD